jgi:hypothetical protein
MTIAEALAAAKRDPGHVYRCEEQGETVEVRVVPEGERSAAGAVPSRRLLTKELCEEDIMLDAWCELPGPKSTTRVRVRPRGSLQPDRIDFPPDGDKPA